MNIKIWQKWIIFVLLFFVLGFSQTERWIYGINGPGAARSIVYGADGNIYAAGGSPGISSQDFTVVSLTSSGDERWVYKYNGPANDMDVARYICYGADGNIYAAGHTKDTDGRFYLTVISLDTSGAERWVYRSSVIGDGVPLTTNAVVVYGADNNIYAIGYRLGGYAAIVSLTLSGAENWVFQRYATVFHSIVYGADGNLYATGEIVVAPSYQNRNFAVVSVTTSGSERWCYQCDIGDWDMGKSIVYGLDGNLYAAGRTGSSDIRDFAVLSVDTSGAERWVNTLNWGSDDIAHSICYGTDGNIYAAGALDSPNRWAVVSYTPSGNRNWIYIYDGPPGGVQNWAHSIFYGLDGNLYTTGWSEDIDGWSDFTIVSTNSSGTGNWDYRDSEGWGWSIVQGTDGNVYAAGEGLYQYTGKGFTVISVESGSDIVPPANPYITKGEKISNSDVKLYWNKVTQDILGNLENMGYYVVYRDTAPSFIPSFLDSIGYVNHPDTTFTDIGALSSSESYYYLIKAVDVANNRSRKSNMGYKLNKFFNENPSTTDKNWVSLPWHSGYTTVSDLATDLSPSGNPLEKITNLRDDQNCESWIWDSDFLEWGGANFTIQSGRGYEMVTIKDTILVLVGSNNPDGLVNLNWNPDATDKNWVSIPYNAVYSMVSDITTEYSPSGNPLEKITNLRDDQNCESWLWDPDFLEWGGANFAIEPGRAYEFVTIVDTTWNPTEYTNNGGFWAFAGNRIKDSDVMLCTGKDTETERAPVWFTPLSNFSTSSYQEAGVSHIVRCHLNLEGFENLIFTAYRLCKPFDALTEKMIGSCIMKKGERAAIWFDVANFKEPWQPGEEVILIIEATKDGRGYFAVINLVLDSGIDIQELSDISLAPICWDGFNNKNVIGYSLYRGDKRLNEKMITRNEHLIEGNVVLKPVIRGGYETVYGSGIQGEESAGRSTLDATRLLEVYPNPFSEKTVIKYALSSKHQEKSNKIVPTVYSLLSTIRIYDAAGRLVRQWDYKTMGQSDCLVWDATDDIGRRVPAGIYFIRMNTDDYQSQRKVIFVH